ncbi:MAG: PepSY domain-containing protein [Gaiellales bacterium]
MNKRTKLIIGGVVAATAVAVTAGFGIAASGDDDQPLRGNAFDRATQAALEHVGEGTVTETEAGDGGASYEVEVRLDDGSQVEVQLDSNFEVIGQEGDDDGPNDTEEGPEDD